MKTREPAHNRWIFSESFVTVEFDKILEEPLDQVEGVRPIGVSRQLNTLERGARLDWFLRFFFFLFSHDGGVYLRLLLIWVSFSKLMTQPIFFSASSSSLLRFTRKALFAWMRTTSPLSVFVSIATSVSPGFVLKTLNMES